MQAASDIGKNEDKHWPILDQLAQAGPGNNNTLKKARHALRQIDRMLDVFEPGQLALSFNGGKDSTVRVTCAQSIQRLPLCVEPRLAVAILSSRSPCLQVMLHLVKAACEQHPTHSFTHVQPIWFQNPTHEFEELKGYVRDMAAEHFTYGDGLKTVSGENLNRLWTVCSPISLYNLSLIARQLAPNLARAGMSNNSVLRRYIRASVSR